MIVGDLFAGVGGMSEGFRQAGFEIAFAVEFDKDIAKAYQLLKIFVKLTWKLFIENTHMLT